MTKAKVDNRIIVIIVAVLLALAFLPMNLKIIRYEQPAKLLRVFIHIALLLWWAVSVSHRIVNVRVRLLLLLTDGLMLFWIIVKTAKYELGLPNAMNRYLWYLYYVPLLIIPMFIFCIAMFAGKAESYRLPKKVYLIHTVSLMFLLLVLTNDLHQLVFLFHSTPFSDRDYSQNVGFYALCVWDYSLGIFSLVRLVGNSRNPKIKRKMLFPIIPLLLVQVYDVLYVLIGPAIMRFFRDTTTVHCFLFVAALEGCIQTGLIASNRKYLELFENCSIPIALRQEGEELLTSGTSFEFTPENMPAAPDEPVITPENQRITTRDIGTMKVYWVDDFTEVLNLSDELKNVNEELEEANEVARFEYEEKRKNLILKEKNRLYNKIQEETKDRLLKIEELLEQVRQANSFEDERETLLKIAVLSVYIKRRNNLLFEAESGHMSHSDELARAFSESLQYLEDFGIGVSIGFMPDREMELDQITEIFNAYEVILEEICLTVQSIRVVVSDYGQNIRLSVLAQSETDYTMVVLPGIEVTREDERDYLFDYTVGGLYR